VFAALCSSPSVCHLELEVPKINYPEEMPRMKPSFFVLSRKLIAFTVLFANTAFANVACPEAFNHDLKLLRSENTQNLCELVEGKPVLIINTASFCGYTGQFSGLEKLHKQYGGQGLVVLGFPSNDFKQEAKEESETAKICYVNYGVSFTMFAPVSVKGAEANSVFSYLSEQHGEPSWNFNKYLVDKNGSVVKRYNSSVKPNSKALQADIESVL